MEALGQMEDEPKQEKEESSSSDNEDSKFFPSIPEPTEEPSEIQPVVEPETKPSALPENTTPDLEDKPFIIPARDLPSYEDVDESVICFDTSFSKVAGGKYTEHIPDETILEIQPPTLSPDAQPPLPPITMVCDTDLGVEIEVDNPYVQVTGMRKHVRYTVKGRDEKDSFAVERRFKEFLALRKRL